METLAGGTGDEPKLRQIVFIALIAIIFTVAYLEIYGLLNHLIWFEEGVLKPPRWAIPVGVLAFSLLVGLCRKYLHAPTVIHGGFTESLKGGGEKPDYRTFPGALLSSLFSLLSGASVGPEGTITVLIGYISSYTRDKLKIRSTTAALGFDVAALASAFNGIIGNILFTGIFATEFQVGGSRNALKFLTWNLLAGTIGYLAYLLLGLPSFARSIPFEPISGLNLAYILYAVVLGILGALLAVFMGLSMQAAGTVMERAFGDAVITQTLAAGAIIACIGYFIPELLFSGEGQIHGILADPARFGVGMLLFMALLKVLLLALSFKSGYLGGPIFPVIFSSTLVGLALHLLFPGIPVSIFVLCIEVAAIALALGAPLTAILLVVVVGTADQNMIVLLVISAVTAMLLGAAAKERRGT
ncbi:chloride channel protein [Methanoculleus bourgensis MS2]|uniref:Chloride channel protein n=1 Tax=Methanoculleus bourgensis (strain ATCC 43281 / DSM 3045 / OCM 15 / MS2) TaxID=1201294 RepID=I7LLE0_METBM|nr:chloride channel protein [Methanoculleus bourgensis]CCJ35284.1 chloride channel protein [Methanoculleus bourgensis MS2]